MKVQVKFYDMLEHLAVKQEWNMEDLGNFKRLWCAIAYRSSRFVLMSYSYIY